MNDVKPQRSFRLLSLTQSVWDMHPTFSIAKLVEHREEKERVDDVVDEKESSEAFDLRWHLKVVEGLFAQVAGEEIAAALKLMN